MFPDHPYFSDTDQNIRYKSNFETEFIPFANVLLQPCLGPADGLNDRSDGGETWVDPSRRVS